jgi:hypothetical protein
MPGILDMFNAQANTGTGNTDHGLRLRPAAG